MRETADLLPFSHCARDFCRNGIWLSIAAELGRIGGKNCTGASHTMVRYQLEDTVGLIFERGEVELGGAGTERRNAGVPPEGDAEAGLADVRRGAKRVPHQVSHLPPFPRDALCLRP